MTALLIVLGVFALAAVVLVVAAVTAPVGHEDTAGFHSHEPKTAKWSRSAMAKAGEESPSLNI